MDLYRYFHPHHNPRLRKTPLRLQEVAELQQAAIELTRALKRAQIRMQRTSDSLEEELDTSPNAPLARLGTAIEAADVLVSELIEVTQQFDDDDLQTMRKLLNERQNAPGWETWTQLLSQRLSLEEANSEITPLNSSERKAG